MIAQKYETENYSVSIDYGSLNGKMKMNFKNGFEADIFMKEASKLAKELTEKFAAGAK